MKECICCKQLRSLGGFYKHPQMKDGHLNKCICCCKKQQREREKTLRKNPAWVEKERARCRDRDIRLKRWERTRPKTEAEFKTQNLKRREQTKRYIEKNPLKRAAHIMVGAAIVKGLLKKMPCEVCGSEIKIHAHHDDYTKPLTVRWLCGKHHRELHRKKGQF